jgi:cytochrome c biogenesis protein CcmG, thiol:disulfide interchange protein DsbE
VTVGRGPGDKARPAASLRPGWQRSVFFWLLVVLSLITLSLAIWQWQAGRRASVGLLAPTATSSKSIAPDFRLLATDGSTVRLEDLRGKVILLNFWATWCPPCRAEMPELDSLYREHGAQHDFVVLGVDAEESQVQVRDYARSHNVSFPLLLDGDGKVTDSLYAVRSLPTSMIIDREGRIRDVWTGQLPKATVLARLESVW